MPYNNHSSEAGFILSLQEEMNEELFYQNYVQSTSCNFNQIEIIDKSQWVSRRIPYKFYEQAFNNTQKFNISLNQEILKYKTEYKNFFLEVILYVLIIHFQGFGNNRVNLAQPYHIHESQIREAFNDLDKQLRTKSSASFRGNKIQMKKTYSPDRRTATIDYHTLNVKDVYPMTIAQYTRSLKNPDLQSLNIIGGHGAHSTHGVSISMALVVYFSCKNNLESVFLEENPGLLSFRIHRPENKQNKEKTEIIDENTNPSTNSNNPT